MLERMTDIFQENFLLFVIGALLFLLIVGTKFLYDIFAVSKEEVQKASNIITANVNQEDKLIQAEIELAKKRAKRAKRKYPFKKTYKEWVFYGGTKKGFFLTLGIGYSLTFLLYFLLCRDLILSFIFSLYFFLVFYMVLEQKGKRNKRNYLRGFSQALEIMEASIGAGNSLESAMVMVTRRDTINKKIIQEFTILNNNLKTNMSLSAALERFYERNKEFDEFSLFAIVLQFFVKKGGRNLKEMFNIMRASVNDKIEIETKVETKITSYKFLFIIFVVGAVAVSLLGNIFMKDFYKNLLAQGIMGYLKAFGSTALMYLSVVMFNNAVRGAVK